MDDEKDELIMGMDAEWGDLLARGDDGLLRVIDADPNTIYAPLNAVGLAMHTLKQGQVVALSANNRVGDVLIYGTLQRGAAPVMQEWTGG